MNIGLIICGIAAIALGVGCIVIGVALAMEWSAP